MVHEQMRCHARLRVILALGMVSAAVGASGALVPASAATAIAPKRIAEAGTIVYCSDMTSPPIEFTDVNGKPMGSDIEIGDEIAKRFGVKVEWKNIPFKGLVPALLAQQCDAVISQLFDKPERRQTIDLVDYMNSSEAFLVGAGNPKKVHSIEDVSGLKVAVENGTTIQDLLEEQNKKFATAGKKSADVVVFPKDTDALQALQIGQVDVYGTTLESGAYYMDKSPKTFEVAGPPFHQILTGIGLRKNDPGMAEGFEKAVDAMKKDGKLLAILTKWHIQGDMIK